MNFSDAEHAFSQQNYLKASEICAQLLRADPDNRDAIYLIAYIAYKKKDYGRTISLSEYGLKINKHDPRFYSLIGLAYKDQGEFLAAFQILQDGLRIIPHDFLLYNNLGTILQILGSPQAAEQAFQLSLHYRADYPEARYNLGTVQLLLGKYKEGWRNYEARFNIYGEFDHVIPRWDGQPLQSDQTLLIYTEQGLGDTLHFIRYLPMVMARTAHIILKVQDVIYPFLMTQNFAKRIQKIYKNSEANPSFDAHCSLLSLPHLFETTLATIPAQMPYFQALPALQKKWQHFLTQVIPSNKPFKIGLVWTGSIEHEANARRSCPLELFQPLVYDFPTVQFVSLQKGVGSEQLEKVSFQNNILNIESQLTDFNETAALITQLDLVISVDTSIVHLAGGLAKPVWMLNRYDSDFRWMCEQTDSPWYPTLRIFRPESWGDWQSVLKQAHAALTDLLAARL